MAEKLRITAFTFLLFFTITAFTLEASVPVSLLVDGKPLTSYPQPTICRGRLFIPATLFRRVGLAVEQKDKYSATIAWPESDVFIYFRAGIPTHAPYPRTNYQPVASFMHKGVLMIPLRSVIDNDNITAEWNAEHRTVSVHRRPQWLRWRMQQDEGLHKVQPDWYSTPL